MGAAPGPGIEIVAFGDDRDVWTRWRIGEWREPHRLLCEHVDSNAGPRRTGAGGVPAVRADRRSGRLHARSRGRRGRVRAWSATSSSASRWARRYGARCPGWSTHSASTSCSAPPAGKRPMPKKQRLDVAMVERGLAPSREKAQASSSPVTCAWPARRRRARARTSPRMPSIEIEAPQRFVSRGGEKLDHALDAFRLDVRGRVALDVGASTGGFTDCLLQRGAARVYAVDVGYGQLHQRLREDPRVVVMERTNIRDLHAAAGAPVDRHDRRLVHLAHAGPARTSSRSLEPGARHRRAGEAAVRGGARGGAPRRRPRSR